MLSQVLQDNGFTAKEAKIYLATLELNNAPASSIARRVNENRVTSYSILKNLIKKGIAHEIIKDKTTYYSVISSKQLAQKFEEKAQSFKDRLPEFLAMENAFDNKPKVQFFEGLEGVKRIYDDIIASPNAGIFSFLGTGAVSDHLAKYLNLHFLPKRVKMGIHAKVLLSRDENMKQKYAAYQSSDDNLLTQYRVLDYDFFKLYNGIDIYGEDKVSVLMFSDEEMSGLIIHSKKLHDSLKSIFNLVRFLGECCPKKDNLKQKSFPGRRKRKSFTTSL